MLACLLAFGTAACVNRGMRPYEDVGDAGPGTAGGNGSGGRGSSGTAGATVSGAGGVGGSTAGRGGAGGGMTGGGVGVGGTTGVAGTTGTTGVAGTTGTTGVAGTTGTAGVAGTTGTTGVAGTTGTTGVAGTTGTAGVAGTTGTTGTAGRGGTTGMTGVAGTTGTTGTAGGGGTTGTGGAGGMTGTAGRGGATGTAGAGGMTGTAGTGGVAGSTAGKGGSSAGAGGHGGSAGTTGGGGASGAGGYMCPLGGVLDCSSSGALKLSPDGQVADFSALEWNNSSGKWCDPRGLDGSVFAYAGATPSAGAVAVDTTAQNLKLNLTVGATGYAGGGLTFDSCVDASGFTSVRFTAAITAGSMTGCSWQVQLQTQDQRPSTATSPSGGTCNPDAGASCYRFPAAAGLAVPTAVASTYTEAFTLFNNPASSAISTPTQVIGIQWQVNSASSGTGTCTVELRIDNITFQ